VRRSFLRLPRISDMRVVDAWISALALFWQLELRKRALSSGRLHARAPRGAYGMHDLAAYVHVRCCRKIRAP